MAHVIVASRNKDKMKEIREILADLPIDILSMEEVGIEAEIVEDGMSFAENAAIKARAVAKLSGEMAIADDSGLVVDALDGEPGIYSARYLSGHPYTEKNRILIERVNDACREKRQETAGTGAEKPGSLENGEPGPLRSARFICAVAAAWPDGRVLSSEGVMEGRIAYEQRGENGFGYDPIFYLPEYHQTSAEIPPEEKNRISHRGKAFRAMRALLLGEDLEGKA